jgi:GWxTD domain-containing protein
MPLFNGLLAIGEIYLAQNYMLTLKISLYISLLKRKSTVPMKVTFCALSLLFTASSFAQSLTSLNFNYWYDPNAQLEFTISPVKSGDNDLIYYRLLTNRKESPADSYSIAWEIRSSLTERNGEPIKAKDSIVAKSVNSISGFIRVPLSTKLWYLVAKVTNTATQEFFQYYKPIDPLWPVNNMTLIEGQPLMKGYATSGSTVSMKFTGGKNIYGFLYKKVFSNALPPFAEAVRTDPFLRPDSVFVLKNSFTPKSIGLYLFQDDTTSVQGVSFLLTDVNYPKYTRISSLAAPLIYITTDDEYSQLMAAKSDKPAFDKVILEITRDKERARNLMRSYFQRVEMANRYFTEYKEGWKTDRGMVYIIYGSPDEVSRTADNEIWFYRNQKTKFVFNKSGSIFCPENYKLERDNKYKEEWFTLVDLWRKSRF